MVKIRRLPFTAMKCKELLNNQSEFIVFDLETTGLDHTKDSIIQIAAIKYCFFDGVIKEIDTLNEYIRPNGFISEKIEKLTGITNLFLQTQRTDSEVFSKIEDFFGNVGVLMGYNIENFDIPFLKDLFIRNNSYFHEVLTIDVLKMARDIIPYKDIKSYKLKKVVEYFGLDKDLQFHNALDDVKATMRAFRMLYSEYKEYKEGTLNPKIFNFYHWQGKRHDLKRIYFCTSVGKIYYDFFNRGWGSSEINIDDINLVLFFDQVKTFIKQDGLEDDDDFYGIVNNLIF